MAHLKNNLSKGSGSGSVGTVVTSHAREVRRSNPVIGKFAYRISIYCQQNWKDANKEKEDGNGPHKNTLSKLYLLVFV